MTQITITDDQTRWIIQVCAFHQATETARAIDRGCWIAWDQSDDAFETTRAELVRRTASARFSRDVEAVESGNPNRMARRVRNILVGRPSDAPVSGGDSGDER